MSRPTRTISRGSLIRWGLLALALGLATTVAVAWVGAVWAARHRGKVVLESGAMPPGMDWPDLGGILIEFRIERGPASERVWWGALTFPVSYSTDMRPWSDLPPEWAVEANKTMYERAVGHGVRNPHLMANAFAERYGWPLHALEVWGDTHGDTPITVHFGVMLHEDLFDSGNPKGSVILPLRPVWIGLLLDWAVFFLAWSASIAAFLATRSKLRLRRGRCPRCAYDLAGDIDAGCPECGWNRSPAPRAA